MTIENTVSCFSDLMGVSLKGLKTGYYQLRGCTVHVVRGRVSDDGEAPAIESDNGWHFEHWKDGILHNDRGPAVVSVKDDKEINEWWLNGERTKTEVKEYDA